MIAFRGGLPLIVLGNRRAIAFDCGWLTRALTVAAHRAGYPNWWLAPHVAESVESWLETLKERTTMPVADFTRAVREALKAIGYTKIGETFEAVAPFARISLVELAQQAGNGFELLFFHTLRELLGEVLGNGGSYCELHGLEQCVKVLRRKRNWSHACEDLRAEIVAFARDRTVSACGVADASGREPGAPRKRELFLHVA